MRADGKRLEYGFLTLATLLMALWLMGMLTGKGLLDSNSYNSYALQADAWRQGRLDLGKDYPWLELAIYEGKYFVSFPPFPSYVLFPLTFIFGSSTPDSIILLIVNMISALFLYKTALRLGLAEEGAMIGSLFVLLGSNMVFVMIDPSVWFMAQSMCFMTTVLSLYFAVTGKGAASLFFWACSVGCRPMQILYVPLLLMILYRRAKEEMPGASFRKILGRKLWWGIPPCAVACSYMALNYLRFGSVLEFGRRYLPEFMRAENGQFHVSYMAENLRSLFRMPEFAGDGRMVVNSMGNLNMLIISPIAALFLVEFVYVLLSRQKQTGAALSVILLLSVTYMTIVVMHRTMGGWHFGNRYSNDILPWIYFGTVLVHRGHPRWIKYQIPLGIAAFGLNLVGSVAVYNGWV